MDRFDMKNFRSNALNFRDDARERAEDLLNRAKIMEFLEEKKEDEKLKKNITIFFAILGVIASVAAISFAVYKLVSPDYLEEYDEDEDPDIVEE